MSPKEPSSSQEAAARALEAEVWDCLGKKDIRQAIDACENLNRSYPEYGSGWHTASQLMSRLGNAQGALLAIEQALKIEPGRIGWQLQHGNCLARLGRFKEVETVVQGLSGKTMRTAYEYSALAMLQTQLGQREEAVAGYEEAARLQPDQSRHYYNVACLQRSLGDLDAAEKNFDTAIRLNPADFESYKIRSDLRKQTAERNHVDELKAVLAGNSRDERGRIQLHYALAKELEDLDRADESFAILKSGSDQRRKLMQYDVSRDLETIEAIKKSFNKELFSRQHEGSDNDEAIFILGLPRTGTTLVERILASHTDVFAAGELNNFAAQLMTMLREKDGEKRLSRDEIVASSAELDFRRLGDAYIASTRPFTGKTPRFIDKMPLNYLYVGLIHLALPGAKIVNVQRDPMDTCYAIYKQLFVDAYPFSYDLEELAQYFVAYKGLMDHWNAVLPGVIHTVQYESLVTDLDSNARELLQDCGLEWQDACLRFHKNREASLTASTAQIRRPIYKSSVGKWRQYETQLAPVVEMLRQAGIAIDEAPR